MTKENKTVEPLGAEVNHSSQKISKPSTGTTKKKSKSSQKNSVQADVEMKGLAAMPNLQRGQIVTVLLEKARRNGGKLNLSDLDEATQRPDLTLEKSVAEYESIYGDLIEKGIEIVDDTDDVLLVSDDGTMIRTAAADISIYGRATQGVRLMRVSDGAKVISAARMEHDFDDGAEDGGR